MAWLAKYAGVCDNCGGEIEVGDQITFIAGMSERHVIHAYCSESTVQRKPAEVCSHCFMEKPCGCDDGQGPS